MLERLVDSIINRLRHKSVSEKRQEGDVRVQYVIYDYKNAQELVDQFEQLKQKATLMNPEILKPENSGKPQLD